LASVVAKKPIIVTPVVTPKELEKKIITTTVTPTAKYVMPPAPVLKIRDKLGQQSLTNHEKVKKKMNEKLARRELAFSGGPVSERTPRRLIHSSIHHNLVQETNLPLPLVNIIEQYLSKDLVTSAGRKGREIEFRKSSLVLGSEKQMLKVFEEIVSLTKYAHGTGRPSEGEIKFNESCHSNPRIQELVTQLVMMRHEWCQSSTEPCWKDFLPSYGDRIIIWMDHTSLWFYWNGTSVSERKDILDLDFPSVFWLDLNINWGSKYDYDEGARKISNYENVLKVANILSTIKMKINLAEAGFEYAQLITLDDSKLLLEPKILDPLSQKAAEVRREASEEFYSRYLLSTDEPFRETIPPPAPNTEVKFTPLCLWQLKRKLEYKCTEVDLNSETFFMVTRDDFDIVSSSLEVTAGLMQYHLTTLFMQPAKLTLKECPEGGAQFMFPQFDHGKIGRQLMNKMFKLMECHKISPHRLFFQQ
jgi:hypothetical protein